MVTCRRLRCSRTALISESPASSWPAPVVPLLGSAGSRAARRSQTSHPASASVGTLHNQHVMIAPLTAWQLVF